MTKNKMVDEVNKLVYNLLIGEGAVHLPSVGSLSVESRSAELSGESLRPPYRMLTFTSQLRGTSLVSAIRLAARCEPTQAQDIYDRWLAHTHDAEVLTIGGVGVLRYKNFTVSPEFDKVLNPQDRSTIRLVRSRLVSGSVVLLVLFLMLLCVAAYFGYDSLMPTQTSPMAVVQPVAEPMPADTLEVADEIDTMHVENVSAELQPTALPTEAVVFTSGRSYVVLGVFSTCENALRVVGAAREKQADLSVGVYRYGAKYMVSVFESDDAAACQQFIRDDTSFSDLWVYKAK
ncbi:MAG: hypothetical protein RSC12_06795 [Alistipes sp.]